RNMHQRMSRRRFLPVLASPLLLSGCSIPGFSNQTAGGPNTVDLWYWNRSIDETLFRAFEQEHEGVTVNDQKIGGDYASKLNTTLAGKAFVPDIVAQNSDIARYFPASDQFVDLYELGASEFEDQYLEWKWKLGVTNDGKMIGFPMDTGPTGLYYRADLFEQVGLPSEPDDVTATLVEWDDYLRAGAQLQEALPEVKFLDNLPNLYRQALYQATNFYVNQEDLYVGDGDQVRRAWDVVVEAKRLDLAANVNAFTPDWSAAMNNGNVASFVGAVWLKQVLLESGEATAGKWRVAQTPGGPANHGGSFIGLTSYAGNEELAFDVITYVQSPENQVAMYKSLALFPSAIEALADPVMSEPEDFFGGQATGLEFAKAAESLKPFYSSTAFAVVDSIMNQKVTDIAVGNTPPDGAWDDAQGQIRRELEHKHPWVRWEE
ncbi:MAG TPA: ABC transporter substrate-binding protein, partial [Thermomicrobiales bacterium]|nr:ABC transporter substrate-binding protein [Thermomicrobiales bacterium]